MAARIKNILSFASIAVGASQTLAHGLRIESRTLVPDVLTPSIEGVATITADATNVTVTNASGSVLSLDVLCEAWHSIERAFGAEQTLALSPQPFVPGAALAAALVGSIIFGSGQDGAAVFDGANTFSFATKVGSTYTLTRDLFLGDGSSCAAGVTIYTAGFRIWCNGTFTNEGLIHNDGRAAALGTAGAGSALGTTGIGTAGGNGRAANTGLPGTNQSNTLGDASAAGGAGGAGGANAGGAAGTYSPGAGVNGGANFLTSMLTGFLFTQTSGGNQASIQIIGGGAGGGGGGSNNAGVLGGGGGGGGGVLVLHALRLINNGTIRANGGAGAAASGGGGDGGGGGGGGGGIILSLAAIRYGTGTYVTTGGAGGAAIAGGVAGSAGSAGHQNLFTTTN